jgi:hypothetical protein
LFRDKVVREILTMRETKTSSWWVLATGVFFSLWIFSDPLIWGEKNRDLVVSAELADNYMRGEAQEIDAKIIMTPTRSDRNIPDGSKYGVCYRTGSVVLWSIVLDESGVPSDRFIDNVIEGATCDSGPLEGFDRDLGREVRYLFNITDDPMSDPKQMVEEIVVLIQENQAG